MDFKTYVVLFIGLIISKNERSNATAYMHVYNMYTCYFNNLTVK